MQNAGAGSRTRASASSSERGDLGAGRRDSRGWRVTTMFCRSGSARGSDSHVLRPMITAWPIVSARKRFRSSGRRHGSRLSAPMTPFAATAAMSASDGAAIDVARRRIVAAGDFAARLRSAPSWPVS